MSKKDIIVSGIRSTGYQHLGNYFGAIRKFVDIQENFEHCYFFIADLHSLTTHPTAEDLYGRSRQVLAEFLACGVDPEKAVLYRQSDVPEIIELYLYLNMNAYLGELERVPTFKEKARKQPDNVNAGLLTYPTLMAADILIHKGNKVPVGKDQEQHLELTRKFARRFNTLYKKEVFPEPDPFISDDSELIKIPGLDGSGKMGKSEGAGNAIYLVDDPKTIKKKVMRAVTDEGPTRPNQEKSAPIENLFTLMYYLSDRETYDFFEEEYNKCTIRYGDLKKKLAEDIVSFTEPFREKINDYLENDNLLREIAMEGAKKARISAQQIIAEVREVIGFKS